MAAFFVVFKTGSRFFGSLQTVHAVVQHVETEDEVRAVIVRAFSTLEGGQEVLPDILAISSWNNQVLIIKQIRG